MQQSWLALTKYKVSAEAGNELAGVTFDLYKQNGDQPDTAADTKLNTEAMTTDAEGVITYAGLVTGTYYFVETGVGESYYLDATPLTFEVTNSDMFDDTDDDTVITVSKVNEELSADLTFQKYFTNEQNENRGIPNATFQLSYSTTEDGNYHDVEVITTDENGVGTNTEALKRGWYTLTELSAPGYVRTGSDDQLFSCHFEVKNVRSTDADGKTIPTVYEITSFTVTDACKNQTLTIKNDQLNAAPFKLTAATDVAAAFLQSEDTNSKDGIYDDRMLGTVTLLKAETDGTTGINQAQFTLEKKVVAENPWQAVKNFLTGNKYENVDATAVADTTTPGKLTIENLPWGDYRIKETKAADGYKLGDSQWHEYAIDAFGEVMARGGAGLVVSSQTGYMDAGLTKEDEHELALTPTEELKGLKCIAKENLTSSGKAYMISKRANHLRVRTAANSWGERGARINTISPGIIVTPLAYDEFQANGDAYQVMIDSSPAKRTGTPDEIASAGAFLLGSEAGFITGTDLLIDGGVIAAIESGRYSLGGR